MFDVDLPNGETYRESNGVRPGEQAVVASTPWGNLGLTICYDVRFAYLHRALAHAGAVMLTVGGWFGLAACTVPANATAASNPYKTDLSITETPAER